MSNNVSPSTAPDFPDVLGMVTGGARQSAGAVHYALALYPTSVTVGQALEALILLQNACNRPVPVAVTLYLPRKDVDGNRMSLVAPKENLTVNLGPGEAGLLHVPIIPYPPTRPSEENVIGVRAEARLPRGAHIVHGPHGGRPASVLSMSPFRLNTLREVGFAAALEGEHVVKTFNILPGSIAAPQPDLSPRYETLWSARELPDERARYLALAERAADFAQTLERSRLLAPLAAATEGRYARAGLSLHPSEALFLGKTLAYTLEDGLQAEGVYPLDEAAWFRRLITVADDDGLLSDRDGLIAYLYTALVRDAVRLGLAMVERASGEKLGEVSDHIAYAQEVVSALETQRESDLGHVYLPLILAGVLVNNLVKDARENPWESLARLREAWRGRIRLAGSQYGWVSEMLSNFMYEAEQVLHRAAVPRPPAGMPGGPPLSSVNPPAEHARNGKDGKDGKDGHEGQAKANTPSARLPSGPPDRKS
ncbi:MAG: hypothetical protein IT323_09250 [Anaerolineae bacterium]|nr:hypothetical protein [Anaerolineae bacterium]